MPSHPRTIFLFSLEPWGDMWYSKHHYAAELAKTHSVFFVSLPDRWRWKDLVSYSVHIRKVPEGLTVLEYRNNLPLRFLPGWLSDLVAKLNALKLRTLLPPGEVVFWCFHPVAVLRNRALRRLGTRVIYHVVDPYQTLPNDRAFAQDADLVVTINSWYLRRYGELNPNCLLVPHGVRARDRSHDEGAVASAQNRWGRYAILAASLGQSINYDLLIRVASAFPSLRLIIAGERFSVDEEKGALRNSLFALPNVSYVGVKHPNELRDLVRAAALGLLTYDIEPTLEVPPAAGRTPLKVLTYLAQLCPVVSTNNSYIPMIENRGHFKAESQEHFVQLVSAVLEGRACVDRAVVNKYLDSVDYGTLIDVILGRLTTTDTSCSGQSNYKP